MSSAGEIVGGVIGGLIGAYFGFPGLGISIGRGIGALIDPARHKKVLPTTYSTRLKEIGYTGSSYNTPIPVVIGGYRLQGNLVWRGEIVEFTRTQTYVYTQRTKKSVEISQQSQVTYYYKTDLLVQLCEGPIAGIARIWFDKKIVYENIQGQPGVEYKYGTFSVYPGTETQTLPSDVPTSYRGTVVILFRDVELTDFGNRIPLIEVEVFGNNCDVDTNTGALIHNNASSALIFETLCTQAAIPLTQIDTTNQIDDYYGFATIGGSISEAIQPALLASNSIIYYSQDKIVFKRKDSNVITTITTSDYAVGESDKDKVLKISTVKKEELPYIVKLIYIDSDRLYDSNFQETYKEGNDGINIYEYSVDLVMDGTKAAKISEIALYTHWQERKTYIFNLQAKFLYLEPGDVIEIEVDTNIFDTVMITSIELGANNLLNCKAVSYDKRVLESYRVGSSDKVDIIRPYPTTDTVFKYFNIPAITINHNTAGIFIGAHGENKQYWQYCRLFKSYVTPDFEYVTDVITPSIMGKADTLLNPPALYNVVDYVNDVTITVNDISQLSSYALSDLYDDEKKNLFIIGDELIQAADITLIASDVAAQTNTYKLSTLIRGRFGTEHYINSHTINEKVALVDSLTFVELNPNTDYNYTLFFKAVSNEQDFNNIATMYEVTSDFRTLTPYSPVHVKTEKDTVTNDLTISWLRRARFGTSLNQSGAELPQLENSVETYEVDIINKADNSIVRTISVSDATATIYSNSDKIADFGTSQVTIGIKVYMISQFVGRGTSSDEITVTL